MSPLSISRGRCTDLFWGKAVRASNRHYHDRRQEIQQPRALYSEGPAPRPAIVFGFNHLYTSLVFGLLWNNNSALEQGTFCVGRGYRRIIQVYKATRLYDLPNLVILARKYIERFGEALSVLDILRAARDIFPKLPKDKIWLPSYIKRNLQ